MYHDSDVYVHDNSIVTIITILENWYSRHQKISGWCEIIDTFFLIKFGEHTSEYS